MLIFFDSAAYLPFRLRRYPLESRRPAGRSMPCSMGERGRRLKGDDMLQKIRQSTFFRQSPRRQQEQTLRRAERHIQRGQLQRAIDFYRAMVAEDPEDLASLNRIGDLLVRTTRVESAVDIFLRVARRYEEDGFLAKATAIYRKVLRCDPLHGEARCRLIDLYRRRRLPVPLFAALD